VRRVDVASVELGEIEIETSVVVVNSLHGGVGGGS